MRTIDILKKGFNFPFKYYKFFILVCFLFFIMEISDEWILHLHVGDISNVLIIIKLLINFVIIGVCLHFVLHCVTSKGEAHDIGIKHAFVHGLSENILEVIYTVWAIIFTAIGAFFTGLYSNLYSVMQYTNNVELDWAYEDIVRIVGNVPLEVVNNFQMSLLYTLIIFSVVFVVMFSFCTIGKVYFIEHEDIKYALNPLNICNIIKKVGFESYAIFLAVTMVVLVGILIILSFLNGHSLVGSIISSIIEGFMMFYFIGSFTLIYKGVI